MNDDRYTKRPGIPTMYKGIRFRSLLEAKWAATFDRLEWKWVYEPFEAIGWVPDFMLTFGERLVLADVKPIMQREADICVKMRSAVRGTEHEKHGLLVIAAAPIEDATGAKAIGWYCDPRTWWAPASFSRIAGTDIEEHLIVAAWADAANEVQWHPSAPTAWETPEPKPVERAPEKWTSSADSLESYFAALALRVPALLERDAHGVAEGLKNPELRAILGAARLGFGEEAVKIASDSARSAIAAAGRKLPPREGEWPWAFGATCQKLRLRRIEEQLSGIAHRTAALTGGASLSEEARRLLCERSELLALKRALLDEPR